MLYGKEFILSKFEENFGNYREMPIAIYGIGKHTEEILQEFQDYKIIGLMDEVMEGHIVYGKPVLSCKDVLNKGVKLIVIIATVANVLVIYNRIAKFCKMNDISVFDVNGTELSTQGGKDTLFSKADYEKQSVLYEKIDRCEIISLDLFDTVFVRKTLLPTDIFHIVENELRVQGYEFPFFKERRRAEFELSQEGSHPKLSEIYDKMKRNLSCECIFDTHWSELELKLERENLLLRVEIKKAIDYARERGKKVFFVSDMYLPSSVLCEWLNALGIFALPEEIIVSCEHGMSKTSGLHSILRNRFPQHRILHIGDNKEADGEYAISTGIDEVFLLNGPYKMLGDSAARALIASSHTYKDRNILGEFALKQFGNPFVFEITNGKVCIDTDYDFGYYFVSPLIMALVKWMLRKVREFDISTLLLSSRDGYLIKEVLDEMRVNGCGVKMPRYIYFYTSRTVCVLAGIFTEEDIYYVYKNIPFSGSAEELLQKRFRLSTSEIQKRSGDDDWDYIVRHKSDIFRHADEIRNNYKAYVCDLGVLNEGKCGFFDFVSLGTCQFFLEKIFDTNLIGLYCMKNYDATKPNLRVESLYQNSNIYEAGRAMQEKYLMLERVMTSFQPTLIDFDKVGHPVFDEENRTENELASLREIHRGIKDACLQHDSENDLMADEFLRLIGKDYAISELPFLKFSNMTDEFCNRNFDIPCFLV